MQHVCGQCSGAFDVSDADMTMLLKVAPTFGGKIFGIPPPTLCPDCRQQRRLEFRNERSLYRRTCDLCKKSIIAIYPADSVFTVYCPDCWWSDRWDSKEFGRDIDFSRPIFPQIRSLQEVVPRISLNVVNNENSEFVNLSGYNKNCYLIHAGEYNEDCLYGTQVIKSIGCMDTLDCLESQYCYEVTNIEKSHSLSFSRDCSNCSESAFLSDCRGCSQCLFCSNLRNKRHYVRNKQVTPEAYAIELNNISQALNEGKREQLFREFLEMHERSLHRAALIINCENASGDFLKNSRNVRHCFDLSYGEDCAYIYTGFHVKDLMDVCHTTDAELGYEGISLGYGSYHTLFTHGSWSGKRLILCDTVQTGSDLCCCVSMKPASFCILNKQHTKEEYETLVPKLIEHMRNTGEWGEFFPSTCAPFAYNESTALDYFPLAKEEVLKKGWRWREQRDEMPEVSRVIPASKLPHSINDIPDDILDWAIECEETKRPFRIVKKELEFYREHDLPVAHLHPDERHRRRMKLRNPRKLWERSCNNCRKHIITSYAPDRPERIVCEECYLKEVY